MSTPQFSILLYVKKDLDSLHHFLQDSHSFFAKFQIPFQVIIASNQGQKNLQQKLTDVCEKFKAHVPIQIFFIEDAKGRAETLLRALQRPLATDWIILSETTLSIPLADHLKLLQELMQAPEARYIWGDRTIHKVNSLRQSKSRRISLERFFTPIVQERYSITTPDPFCEVGVLRLSKAQPALQLLHLRSKSWYFHLFLIQNLKENSSPARLVPILDTGNPSIDFSVWKEACRLVF